MAREADTACEGGLSPSIATTEPSAVESLAIIAEKPANPPTITLSGSPSAGSEGTSRALRHDPVPAAPYVFAHSIVEPSSETFIAKGTLPEAVSTSPAST